MESVGDSLGSLGEPVGDSLGSLGSSVGDSLGSLGDSPGLLGVSVGLEVGRCSVGMRDGRCGTGEVDPVADSSTARGLDGATCETSVPAPRL